MWRRDQLNIKSKSTTFGFRAVTVLETVSTDAKRYSNLKMIICYFSIIKKCDAYLFFNLTDLCVRNIAYYAPFYKYQNKHFFILLYILIVSYVLCVYLFIFCTYDELTLAWTRICTLKTLVKLVFVCAPSICFSVFKSGEKAFA